MKWEGEGAETAENSAEEGRLSANSLISFKVWLFCSPLDEMPAPPVWKDGGHSAR